MAYLPFQLYLNRTETQSLVHLFDNVVPKHGTLQPLQHQIQRQWIADGGVPQAEVILFDDGQLPPLQNTSYITILCVLLVSALRVLLDL